MSKASLKKQDVSVDSITCELIRNSLRSAAAQMKQTLVRTAFSPVIYAQNDFAAALYDADCRLVIQAATMPSFLGTLGSCIRAAVASLGGAQALSPGDVIAYNMPHEGGTHPQDMGVFMPSFVENRLVGYAIVKAHLRDIAAISPYPTNSQDVFQEGLLLPGIKIHEAGKPVEAIFRIVAANSRAPRAVSGDLRAEISACRVGARELERLVDKFSIPVFERALELLYDQGEAFVRRFLEQLPDGRYSGRSYVDSDGLDDELITFDVFVDKRGNGCAIDFTAVPKAHRGPVNCPLPSTIGGARVVVSMLAGATDSLNEGYFRPIEVLTTPGTMFHPVSPEPCFLYGWPLASAFEAIFEAFAKAKPGVSPAGSAGDLCAVQVYTVSEADGELNKIGGALPAGHGGHARGDGAIVYIPIVGNQRLVPAELEEAKFPILFEKLEFTQDTAGAGEFRGATGWEKRFRMLGETRVISIMERCKVPGAGAVGGTSGAANSFSVEYPDGREEVYGKKTWFSVPAGALFKIRVGGGGGYGAPSKRTESAIQADLQDGVVSPEFVRKHYAHAAHLLK